MPAYLRSDVRLECWSYELHVRCICGALYYQVPAVHSFLHFCFPVVARYCIREAKLVH
jgi:hypothetical protein